MSNSNKDTLSINVDGNEVMVAELPKPIRDNVDMFNKVRAKMDTVTYELNILNHAAISLNSRILIDAAEYLKAVKEAQETAEAEAEVGSAPKEKVKAPKSLTK
jgi:hypothetical protein